MTIYRGSAWPVEMRGQALVGDVGGNLVHRKALDAAGLALVGRRIDPDRELLTSTDNWFRPVQFAQAPDGCLYVIDMYREVIEHPRSLPPEIKRHLDLTSGRDRGRIYRLAPDGFKLPPAPQLDRASTAELVATLAHPNGWHRDTAARLLFEGRDPAAELPLADSGSRQQFAPGSDALRCTPWPGSTRLAPRGCWRPWRIRMPEFARMRCAWLSRLRRAIPGWATNCGKWPTIPIRRCAFNWR